MVRLDEVQRVREAGVEGLRRMALQCVSVSHTPLRQPGHTWLSYDEYDTTSSCTRGMTLQRRGQAGHSRKSTEWRGRALHRGRAETVNGGAALTQGCCLGSPSAWTRPRGSPRIHAAPGMGREQGRGMLLRSAKSGSCHTRTSTPAAVWVARASLQSTAAPPAPTGRTRSHQATRPASTPACRAASHCTMRACTAGSARVLGS